VAAAGQRGLFTASGGCLARCRDVPQRQVRLGVAGGPLPPGQRDVPGGERLVRDLAQQVADDVEPAALLVVGARDVPGRPRGGRGPRGGVPLGLAAGRPAWNLAASDFGVPSVVTAPWPALAAATAGTLAAAIIAAGPATFATGRPAALGIANATCKCLYRPGADGAYRPGTRQATVSVAHSAEPGCGSQRRPRVAAYGTPSMWLLCCLTSGQLFAPYQAGTRAGSLVSTHSPCSGCSSSPAGASPHTPAAGSSYSEAAILSRYKTDIEDISLISPGQVAEISPVFRNGCGVCRGAG